MTLLQDYGTYHTDRRNLVCHEIGIPLIVLAIAALLRLVPLGPLDLAAVVMAAVVVFYLRIDLVAGIAAALVFLAIWVVAAMVSPWGALALFVAGWIFQFVGHAYEGKRPAFTTNLVHLLVGPLWIVAKVARRA